MMLPIATFCFVIWCPFFRLSTLYHKPQSCKGLLKRKGYNLSMKFCDCSDGCEVPYGTCHCGCGNKTSIPKRSHLTEGRVKGRPNRFIRGHGRKKCCSNTGEKWCSLCKRCKPKELFGKDKNSRDNLAGECKSCRNARQRGKNKQLTPAEIERRYFYDLKYKYKIGKGEFNTILDEQGGSCAICGFTPFGNKFPSNRLFVDHCHSSGKVRGLLCNDCNKAIGLMKDSSELLQKAISYLEYR